MATTAQRKHVGRVLDQLWTFRAHLGYPPHDVRGSQDAAFWAMSEDHAFTLLEQGRTLYADCSQLYAWTLRCAGLWHWSAPGYTGVDLDVCKPHYTDGRLALVGAGVIYGPGTGHHVTPVWVPDPKGGDPVVFSHGHAGVDRMKVSQMAAGQAAEGYPGHVYVSIQHL